MFVVRCIQPVETGEMESNVVLQNGLIQLILANFIVSATVGWVDIQLPVRLPCGSDILAQHRMWSFWPIYRRAEPTRLYMCDWVWFSIIP